MTKRLDDGFPTLVSFSLASAVKLWEKEVTPPGIDGTGVVDTTTMRNTTWRTFAPKKLRTLSEMSFTAAYDPAFYGTVESTLLNENGQVTVHFSDNSTLEFWGVVTAFKPNSIKEGEQPTATVTIIPTNQDTGGVEQAPVYSGS